MTVPSKFLLSDLLNHNVRCDQGLDHGPGVFAWMHPPVHRLLGWASRPSSFRLIREVWRLDQLKGIGNQDIYVKGSSAGSDQATLERFPTLLYADIINKKGLKLGVLADFVFEFKTGKILYYLVSRTNPKIPGTSRWRLSIPLIVDQQPGSVFCNIITFDDLPIQKASFRQDFIKKSRKWRTQFQDLTFKASDRLEGWIEDQDWDLDDKNNFQNNDDKKVNGFNNWIDDIQVDTSEKFNRMNKNSKIEDHDFQDTDPWI